MILSDFFISIQVSKTMPWKKISIKYYNIKKLYTYHIIAACFRCLIRLSGSVLKPNIITLTFIILKLVNVVKFSLFSSVSMKNLKKN